MIGRTVGQYQIIDKIGEGGMGTVYKAEDSTLNRLVALKTLSGHLARDEEAKERFIREAQSASSLNHPNITTVFEFVEDEDARYISMEYVEGKTIRDMVESGIVSVRKAIDIIIQAAEALEAAHNKGILHRDVKSANVMVNMEGRVKVMDFGLAQLAGSSQLTRTGTTMGTLSYSSPEQISGRTVDRRSELFSLGVVFYELLTGQLPFKATNEAEVLFSIINNEPPRLTSLREDIPGEVEAVVSKMLEKDTALRYQTCGDFIDELKGLRKGMDTSTVNLSRALKNVPPRKRQSEKLGSALGAWIADRPAIISRPTLLGGLMILALGILTGVLIKQPAVEATGQVGWFEVDVQLGYTERGAPLDITPDGSRIVFSGVADDGGTRLYRRDLGDPAMLPIPGTEGLTVGNLTISPDGQSVGYSMNAEFWVIAIQGGAARSIGTMTSVARGASWGPGDSIVLQQDIGNGLVSIPAEGGEPRVITTVDESAGEMDHRWPFVLPDGESILFTIWYGDLSTAEIGYASLKTGEYRSLLPGFSPRYVEDGYLVYAGAEEILRIVEFDAMRGMIRGTPVTVLNPITVGADGSANYTISANGTIAFLSKEPNLFPVFVDREGRVESLQLEPDEYQSPSFSPDGNALAIARGSDIWIYDFLLETFTPLTFDGGFYPLWTPEGDRILFSRDEGADVNIYEVPVDRAEEPSPLYRTDGQHRTQSLSPDGQHLLIRQTISGHYELWILDRDNPDQLEPWLVTDFLERAPVFSPDGKWIAFTSNESGRDEVYVRPFPGPGGRIPVSTDGGTEPAWAPGGNELYFRSGDQVLGVSVETGDVFRLISQPETVIDGRYYMYAWHQQYDPHPDGERFLMLLPESESSSMMVVMNWFQREISRLRSR
ncbi:protein kinase [Gemmatimonadota bacterium]